MSFDNQIEFIIENSTKMSLNERGLGVFNTNPQGNLHINGNTIIKESISIGTSNHSGNFNFAGSIYQNFATVTSNTTLGSSSLVFADTQSNNLFLTLPYAGNASGQTIEIKKTSPDNFAEIFATEGIDQAQNIILSTAPSGSLPSLKLISDSKQWYIRNLVGQKEADTFNSDNLVLYLKFDTSGDNRDYGPNDFTVIRNNFASSTDGYTDGQVRGGLEFNGTSESLSIPDNSALDFTTEVTSTVWVKRFTPSPGTNDISEFDQIISKGSAYTYFPRIEENDEVMILLNFTDGSNTGELQTGSISDSEWHFIACTFNNITGEISIYIDGVISNTWTGYSGKFINNDNGSLNISAGNPLTGVVDELRLYNKSLSVSELDKIYEHTKLGF